MEKLSIAKVLKPQGLKGELKCLPLAEQSDVFSNLTYVYLNEQKLNVISSVYRLGYVYIRLENVDTIEHADKFRNAVFYVDREQFGTLQENTFFVDELVGCKVFNKNGEFFGDILGVENYGASDILEVKHKWGTYMVPFISKVFLDVNIAQQKVVIDEDEFKEHCTS